MIDASRKMDAVIMAEYSSDETRSYREYSSYVRYLKFFLASRLNYLNELWNIDYARLEIPESSGELHKVRFFEEDENLIETRYILDGESISEFPESKGSDCADWKILYSGKVYDDTIPIFGDIDFFH